MLYHPVLCSSSAALAKNWLAARILRFTDGNTTFAWRHYGCITAKQFENIKNDFDEADDVDGFEDLTPEDQEKFRKAFAEGHGASFVPACDRVLSPGSPFPRVDSVSFCSYMPRTVAEEDIPETARKEPELDEDGNPIESPKKGRGKGKKAKDADEDGDADEVGDCSDAALAPMAGLSHTPEDSSYSAG
jgi:hypothetical protein